MKSSNWVRLVVASLLLAAGSHAFAQDDPKPNKKQRKAEQKKEQRAHDEKKAEVKGKKRHMQLQDKETRKRMKRNKKKGKAYVSRNQGFFYRIFKPFR